jgi:hypothetical protein
MYAKKGTRRQMKAKRKPSKVKKPIDGRPTLKPARPYFTRQKEIAE